MRRVAALSAMVMALALAHAVPAEARPVGQSWYRLKEGVVKLTRADATLTRSQRLDNGVLRTHAQYVGGQKRNTFQTFTSSNGDVTLTGAQEPAVRQAERKPLLQRLLVPPVKRERPATRPVLPSSPYGAPRWHPMARRSAPNYRNMR